MSKFSKIALFFPSFFFFLLHCLSSDLKVSAVAAVTIVTAFRNLKSFFLMMNFFFFFGTKQRDRQNIKTLPIVSMAIFRVVFFFFVLLKQQFRYLFWVCSNKWRILVKSICAINCCRCCWWCCCCWMAIVNNQFSTFSSLMFFFFFFSRITSLQYQQSIAKK